jgi:hypothetical protein
MEFRIYSVDQGLKIAGARQYPLWVKGKDDTEVVVGMW